MEKEEAGTDVSDFEAPLCEIDRIQKDLVRDRRHGVSDALDYLDRVKRLVVEIKEAQIEDGEAWWYQEHWADELERGVKR